MEKVALSFNQILRSRKIVVLGLSVILFTQRGRKDWKSRLSRLFDKKTCNKLLLVVTLVILTVTAFLPLINSHDWNDTLSGTDDLSPRVVAVTPGEMEGKMKQQETTATSSSTGDESTSKRISGTASGVPTSELQRKMINHSGDVTDVACNPDGSKIASSSKDGTVKLWEMENGTVEFTLENHASTATAVAFDPRGKLLASGSEDKTVKIWNVTSGEEIRSLPGHAGTVTDVAFSPDGTELVSSSEDQTIKKWNFLTGEENTTMTGHSGSVTCVTYSPDGKTLATGSKDQTVMIWNVTTGTNISVLTGHVSGVTNVAFNPDGQLLASSSVAVDLFTSGTIKIWNTSTGNEVISLMGYAGDITSVVFTPDGRGLASSSTDRTVKLWDWMAGKVTRTLVGHRKEVTSVAFSSEGQTLVSGSEDDTIILWNVLMSSHVEEWSLEEHSDMVTNVEYCPSGKILASVAGDGIRLWNASTRTLMDHLMYHTSVRVRGISFSPDGEKIASCGGRELESDAIGNITFWNVSTGEILYTIVGSSKVINDIQYSPDGRLLAYISYTVISSYYAIYANWTLTLLNTSSYEVINTLSIPATVARYTYSDYISFSPDSQLLTFAVANGSIFVFNVSSQTVIFDLIGHNGNGLGVVFSPDGKLLASSSTDSTVKIWDLDTGTNIRNLTGHVGSVNSVNFSPNGTKLVTSSFDKKINVWDVATGRLLRTLVGHVGEVYDAVFSPDGLTIASGGVVSGYLSREGPLKLWRWTTDPKDIDYDGIADTWESDHGYNSTNYDDRFADPDNDDLMNVLEYLFGTATNLTDTDGDNMLDRYEYLNNLNGTDDDASQDKDGDGIPNWYEHDNDLLAAFDDANSDSDGDGMRNLYEFQHGLLAGTDDAEDDNDNDGLPNYYECQYLGLDPSDPYDAEIDLDGDYLTNLDEYYFGTNPRNNDTDSDGMDDYYEYLMDLDPLIDDANEDSDDDGMPNIYEFEYGLLANKNDAGEDKDGDNLSNYDEYNRGTYPNDSDSDDDGVPDWFEVLLYTNPLDATENPILTILIIIVVLVSFLGLFAGVGIIALYRSRNRIKSWLKKVYGSYRPSETEILSYSEKAKKMIDEMDKEEKKSS
jgi:WD40 repeat protein